MSGEPSRIDATPTPQDSDVSGRVRLAEHERVFKAATKTVATVSVTLYALGAGLVAGRMTEPSRSTALALSYFPLALVGVFAARAASSRSNPPVRGIWRLYRLAMGSAALGALSYAGAFGLGLEPLSYAGVAAVAVGITIFIRIYWLALRLLRGTSENVLELVDFATVAFCTCAVLVYGLAEPLVQSGNSSRLHTVLLPAFAAVFIVASLYVLTSSVPRLRAPEYVFLAAGIALFGGSLADSAAISLGDQMTDAVWFVSLRSVAMLVGLALLSAAPFHAVQILEGSEVAFRGPWRPPRFFLPYWSLLALVVLAIATVLDGRRSAVAYGFATFAGATALVVIRQLLTIRENYRLFRQLAEADERRSAFLRELLRSVEEERIRLANSIEAGPIQQLTALLLRSERAAQRETTRPKLLLEALERQLSTAIGELRHLTRSLRPRLSQARGLSEALRIEAREAFQDGAVELELEIEDVEGLRPEQELHLFRIAEEAIDNVRVHSGASKVRISLRSVWGLRAGSRRVLLEVQDDGKGFVERSLYSTGTGPRASATTGIPSMRERADLLGADFLLLSTPGAGTLVRVELEIETARNT